MGHLMQHGLDGVEIVYFDDGRPVVGFVATWPWGTEQILVVPVEGEG
jgi:hypothetical protein